MPRGRPSFRSTPQSRLEHLDAALCDPRRAPLPGSGAAWPARCVYHVAGSSTDSTSFPSMIVPGPRDRWHKHATWQHQSRATGGCEAISWARRRPHAADLSVPVWCSSDGGERLPPAESRTRRLRTGPRRGSRAECGRGCRRLRSARLRGRRRRRRGCIVRPHRLSFWWRPGRPPFRSHIRRLASTAGAPGGAEGAQAVADHCHVVCQLTLAPTAVAWSFELRRGDPAAELWRTAGDHDVLCVPPLGQSGARAWGWVLGATHAEVLGWMRPCPRVRGAPR